MPITFTKSFKASDGKCYGTLEEAQVVEIAAIFRSVGSIQSSEDDLIYAEEVLRHKDAILNILTTTESSRPAARKANGATRKPRTLKPKIVPDPATQPLPGV